MRRKHFIVETYLPEDTVQTGSAKDKKANAHQRVDYFQGMSDKEKAYFQPIRPGEIVSLNY